MDRIGRYEIESEIGTGGFGVVYRARDPVMRREVAIKLLTGSDDSMRSRFHREAGTTGNLSHKNVVTVYDYGIHQDGRPYLVMEFLVGRTLADIIRDGPPPPLLEKVDIIAQVAEGLDYAHKAGIVHRDIKPANVIVLDNGTVKVLDFGIAKILDDDSTRETKTGFLIGTMEYISADQIADGMEADDVTDIYSFGVTCYELLTGVQPFRAALAARTLHLITNTDPRPITQVAPECPEGLALIIHTAIARRRRDRYTSLRDFLLDLAPIQAELRRARASGMAGEAEALLRAGDLDGAQAHLRHLLELDPANEKGQELRRAMQRQPEFQRQVSESIAAAEALVAEGRQEAAVEAFEALLAKIPPAETAGFRRDVEYRLACARFALQEEIRLREEAERARAEAERQEHEQALLHQAEANRIEADRQRREEDLRRAAEAGRSSASSAPRPPVPPPAQLPPHTSTRRYWIVGVPLALAAAVAVVAFLHYSTDSARQAPARTPLVSSAPAAPLVADSPTAEPAASAPIIEPKSTTKKPSTPVPKESRQTTSLAPAPKIAVEADPVGKPAPALSDPPVEKAVVSPPPRPVTPPPAVPLPPVVQFGVDSASVVAGQPATLRWDVTGAATVSIDHGIGLQQTQGARRVSPDEPVTYTLTATGPGGATTATATINVTAASSPVSRVRPPPSLYPASPDRDAVLRVLAGFSQAVQRKDDAALRELWPAIPTRTLDTWRSDFRSTRSMSIEFSPKNPPAITGGTARVECAITTRKVLLLDDRPFTKTHTGWIALRNNNGVWIIQSMP